MTSLTSLSALTLAKGIRRKNVSSYEVVSAFLEKIKEHNPRINALVQTADDALEQAKQCDRDLENGLPLGKLHGIPITIKDSLHVKGFKGSLGCEKLIGNVSEMNATLVERLRNEGAIVIGISNVPELLACTETSNRLYGKTNNPYDLERTSGGSSGGESAILAVGGSALGIGSDAAGSIRIPAHYCGIAGLKPTHGLIPSTGGLLGESGGIFTQIATNGPMGRFVEDLALCLSIIAGPDHKDPHIVPMPVRDYTRVDLKQLRGAYYTYDGYSEPTKETIESIESVVAYLKKQTACIDEKRAPCLSKAYDLVWKTIFFGSDQGEGLADMIHFLNITEPSDALKEYLEMSRQHALTTKEFKLKLREMDLFRNEMHSFYHDCDYIICPVVATPAKLHGKSHKEIEDCSYSMAYNLTGWPSAVVRCGTSKDGLPIGVQIIAKKWRDDIALAVASSLEKEFGGWKPA